MNLAGKLDSLLVDLRAIEGGYGPTREELDQAPLLINWRSVAHPGMALEGLVLGHPVLGTARITTSMVYSFNEDRLWARTLSRYYKLSDNAD